MSKLLDGRQSTSPNALAADLHQPQAKFSSQEQVQSPLFVIRIQGLGRTRGFGRDAGDTEIREIMKSSIHTVDINMHWDHSLQPCFIIEKKIRTVLQQ